LVLGQDGQDLAEVEPAMVDALTGKSMDFHLPASAGEPTVPKRVL
jgi:hypothetical protein